MQALDQDCVPAIRVVFDDLDLRSARLLRQDLDRKNAGVLGEVEGVDGRLVDTGPEPLLNPRERALRFAPAKMTVLPFRVSLVYQNLK